MNVEDQLERPAILRRRVRAAADEHVDPVNYVSPTKIPAPAPTAVDVATTKATTSESQQPIKRGPGRPRREPTIQLGVRVALDVSSLIDELADEDGTTRAVVENAVRAYARSRREQDTQVSNS